MKFIKHRGACERTLISDCHRDGFSLKRTVLGQSELCQGTVQFHTNDRPISPRTVHFCPWPSTLTPKPKTSTFAGFTLRTVYFGSLGPSSLDLTHLYRLHLNMTQKSKPVGWTEILKFWMEHFLEFFRLIKRLRKYHFINSIFLLKAKRFKKARLKGHLSCKSQKFFPKVFSNPKDLKNDSL